MARTPQAIGNYGLGAILPSNFTGGAEPIEDSPLTKRNTPTINNPGGTTPAREISSAVTGLMALEATPGNDRYIELAMRRYSQHIDKQVGEEPDGPLGPEVKAMNPLKPEKYAGEDDINKFDEWLVQLLAHFQIFKIMGPRTDATHVQYTGLHLSGLAQQWYSQEVLAPTRCVRHWSFEDLIFGLFRRFIHEASAQNAAIQYNRTKYSADKGVLAFYNKLTRRVDRMVEPPDSYSFRKKYLGGLPQTIVKMALEVHRISAEHSSIEEILDKVKHIESAQKVLNLYTKQSAQVGGGRSPMPHASSEPTDGRKDGGSSTSKRFKLVRKGNKVYRRPINRDKGNNTRDANRPYSPAASKGENSPKAGAPAMSSSSSFRKGINCFNCGYEAQVQEAEAAGRRQWARLNALEVHKSDLGNVKESDGDHPNAEELTGSPQDPVGNEPEFMDLMDLYSVIDEEGEDDELVGYLGAMHPIECTVMESDNEIVYCRVMNVIYGELPQQQPISVDDKGRQVPKGSTGKYNQEWTWEEPYGVVHQGDCKDCARYSIHLMRALGDDIPSAIAAVNYPSAMAWHKFD